MRIFQAVLLCAAGLAAQEPAPLQLEQTFPLPEVQGRIDHLAADVKNKRLFVAALGNNTVEVLDSASGRRIHTLTGLAEPQGVLYLPELDRLFVAGGGDGACRAFGGISLRLLNTLKIGDDADNLRYDVSERRVWVGYGKGALASFDAQTSVRGRDIPLEGHPEAFQIESSGPRIFVNVPAAGSIAVIDRLRGVVTAKWPVKAAAANFPLALAEKDHLLFTGCRRPPKVVVFDMATGRELANFDISADTDDLFYDARKKRIYVSCGAGFVDVFEHAGPTSYNRIGRIPTLPGARTSLFVPDLDRLFVALPARESHAAEVRVYRVQP